MKHHECNCEDCQRERKFHETGATDAIDAASVELDELSKRHAEIISGKLDEEVQPGTALGLILVSAARIAMGLGISPASFVNYAISSWNSEQHRAEARNRRAN